MREVNLREECRLLDGIQRTKEFGSVTIVRWEEYLILSVPDEEEELFFLNEFCIMPYYLIIFLDI